jgi:hypothetical protein
VDRLTINPNKTDSFKAAFDEHSPIHQKTMEASRAKAKSFKEELVEKGFMTF